MRIGLLKNRSLMVAAPITSLMVLAAAAGVVDRVAVVVGDTVITESEVLDELRLTEFLNSQPPDTRPEQRRAAAERLVDSNSSAKKWRSGITPNLRPPRLRRCCRASGSSTSLPPRHSAPPLKSTASPRTI